MLWSIREKMRPALSVVEMIPDVHRTPALAALRKAAQEGRAGNLRLSADEKEVAFYDGPVALVSPVGARLLKALYQSGRIKLKKPAAKKLPTLDAYIQTEAAFMADVARLIAEDDARRDRLALIVADPAVARPDELTPYLIDKVATAKLGHGATGSFEIAGLTAHRTRAETPDAVHAQTLDADRLLCWWIDGAGNRQGDSD